ncbi:hypothetical protein A1O7_01767 [Cladophialophora yegresii CBS 114405]|uniref:BZIP domain-containing protein n=1 Tax=Cladophialophora yegresii CBS 114405 TaxID=1182544 RepID=W9WLF7_9EURO|nr:uncharacterized protein A1O7_01767 [Cladophialophora yegresii CBS 114405]EXJ65426.1 hypothetical protein A1O7_01767 [Cladophialophora yegresii CBS 114405]
MIPSMAGSRNEGVIPIPIQPMRQLADAVTTHDDWTGVTSAAERRKRQNRLNSRAFRRRRAHALEQAQPPAQLQAQSHPSQARGLTRTAHTKDKGADPDSLLPCWSQAAQSVIWAQSPLRRDARNPLLTYTAGPPSLDTVIFPLCPDHLIVLLQYNVLRASLVNRGYIARLPAHTQTRAHAGGESAEWSSTTVACLPNIDVDVSDLDLSRLLPPSLHPTRLQRTVKHAAWIDILPHPVLRDNLIGAASSFDEDALWTDTVGGLFHGFAADLGAAEYGGGIVWDTPWDVSGWEVSVGFWRKYAWVFRGCEAEVLSATNQWRRKRGEHDLVWKEKKKE